MQAGDTEKQRLSPMASVDKEVLSLLVTRLERRSIHCSGFRPERQPCRRGQEAPGRRWFARAGSRQGEQEKAAGHCRRQRQLTTWTGL